MHRIRRLGIPFGVVVLACIVGFGLRAAVAQDTVEDLRDAREASRRDAAEAAAELDALSAEDAELVEALAAIDAHIALQEARIDAVVASIEQAEAQVDLAQAQAEELAVEVESIRARLRERAVEAFVAPRTDDLAQLNTADINEGALRRSFLDEIVGDEYELLDQLRVRVAEQEAAERLAAGLLAEAEADRAELEQRLQEFDDSRREAEALRAEVQVRIDDWQRLSDEIEAADRLIAEEIVRLEEEARRLAAEEEARRLAEEEARRLAEEEAAAEEDGASAGDDEPGDDDAVDGDSSQDGGARSEGGSDGESGDFSITHRPVPGEVTSPFGDRVHPIFGTVRMHFGVDFDGETGDPIVAAADGVVLFSGWRNGYGNTIMISHGGGWTTLYAHQTDNNVSVGQEVAGGELIGWVGSTGWSTGSHLHFEVRRDGVALDPAGFL